MVAIDVVRSTLLPVLEPYLERRDDAQRAALGEALGAAIASLPADVETLDLLEVFSATFLQVVEDLRQARVDPSPLAPTSVLSAWLEDLRYRVYPPALAEGACDCALRELFHVLTPPPADQLEPVSSTSDGEALRCRRCERRWWRDATPRPFSWCRVRTENTATWDVRGARRSWLYRRRWSTCPCARARWLGSAHLRWEGKKCTCADPAATPSPPVTEADRGPWHLLGEPALRTAALTLGEQLDDYLLVPAERNAAIEVLPAISRAIAATHATFPVSEVALAVVDALTDQFDPAVNAHLGSSRAQTPVFPWGIGLSLRMLRTDLHRRVLQARFGGAPCDCAIVKEIQDLGQPGPSSDRLVPLDENDWIHDRWTLYRCDHCGQGWKHVDQSTESSSWSNWNAESVSRTAPPLDLAARARENAERDEDERRRAERRAEEERARAAVPVVTHQDRRRAAAEEGRRQREADARARADARPFPGRGERTYLGETKPGPFRHPNLRDHLALRLACGASAFIPVVFVAFDVEGGRSWTPVIAGLGLVLPGLLAGVLARKLRRWWFVWALLCPLFAGIPALVLAVQPVKPD